MLDGTCTCMIVGGGGGEVGQQEDQRGVAYMYMRWEGTCTGIVSTCMYLVCSNIKDTCTLYMYIEHCDFVNNVKTCVDKIHRYSLEMCRALAYKFA